jgi:hypothetical protein
MRTGTTQQGHPLTALKLDRPQGILQRSLGKKVE